HTSFSRDWSSDVCSSDLAVRAMYPQIADMAVKSRHFLIRAVRFLAAEAGVRQFLDIGTGLPTMQNTHEVAQSVAPDAKIVYVDKFGRAPCRARSETEVCV